MLVEHSHLAGSDAALFNVNATTGEIKSKAFLILKILTDDGADNVYDITLVYTKDAVKHSLNCLLSQ